MKRGPALFDEPTPLCYTTTVSSGGSAVCMAWTLSTGGSTSARQRGHVVCEASHTSMHSTWYRCLKKGSHRTISPACTVPRHTEHCTLSLPPSRHVDCVYANSASLAMFAAPCVTVSPSSATAAVTGARLRTRY
ncbi:hypothetical protein U9M48_027455 [Paspalum notatum var. saurae]|uniref:Uncharacterized protein n=1 Tax=Paspalum notatum var. saurae TaxID=547442 RepID=A0AAQ3WZG7_PASNO